MPAPSNASELLELVKKSELIDLAHVEAYEKSLREQGGFPNQAGQLAGLMVRDGLLTHFQVEHLLQGKWRRFTIGKYKVLERLGAGGMGSVYLCEHKLMRRRVALKVLPTAKAGDPASLDRFYREARAVAALDHPNIVRAYDIDHEEKLHFLVMEHVDGASLQEIIQRTGPMEPIRVAHYMRQAALGLQHAYESAGLVHRDIKPGNILVDRSGIVKILDMGLARFFHDEDDIITQKYDENVLGTADYLAPEQAVDSHGADIRADIYSLGATMYFCLNGKAPFAEGTVAQKLIWHQSRQPKPIRTIRPEVPQGLADILDQMMIKDRDLRYQLPVEIADALTPWTGNPIAPPPEAEMPKLSAAATRSGTGSDSHLRGSGATQQKRATSGWEVRNSTATTPSTPKPVAPPPATTPSRPSPQPSPPARSGPLLKAAPLPAKPTSTEESNEGEPPAWEEIAGDTDNITARLETTRSSARREAKANQGEPGPSRRIWLYVLVGGIFVFGGGLTAFFLGGDKNPVEPLGPRTLYVGGEKDPHQNLRSALAAAQPGDTIVVRSATVKERLVITGESSKHLTNVKIQADPNITVDWRLPAGELARDRALIHIQDVEGIEIEGFRLNGDGKLSELVRIRYSCKGVALRNLDLRGYTKHGINFVGCKGSQEQPVLVRGIRVDKDNAPAFRFYGSMTIPEHALNRFITIEDYSVPPTMNPVIELTAGVRKMEDYQDVIDRKNVRFPPDTTTKMTKQIVQ